MKATDVINAIKASSFVKDVIMSEFPSNNGDDYTTYKQYFEEEIPLRGEKDLFFSKAEGKPYLKKSTKRVDLAAFIQISERKYAGYFPLIGFEVKVSMSDLKQDSKFYKYLPYFDYFYFAVPTEIEDEALEYLEFTDCGLVSIDNSGIVATLKDTKRNDIDKRKQRNIYASFVKRLLDKQK